MTLFVRPMRLDEMTRGYGGWVRDLHGLFGEAGLNLPGLGRTCECQRINGTPVSPATILLRPLLPGWETRLWKNRIGLV